MQRLVILLLLLATAFAWGNNSPMKDVCVIGGGPSGLAAAVFAKDRGASVLVLERDDEYGGNCNTETFKGAPTGAPNYIDIGTAAFQNTALLRAINNDTWTIDSVAIAKRFAGNSSVVLLDLTNPATASPTYGADFAQGFNIGLLSSTPEQASAVGEALGRWLSIHKKYPWIEESKWVSPIPNELLLPFTTLIENYQLQPLVVGLFNQLLFGGGFSDYSQLTSLYALAAIKPALVYLLSVPNAGFSINGGCIKMYDGMVNYIGRSNVLTGVDVVRTERPPKGPRGNTHATVTYSSGKGSRCRFEEVRCKNLIIAFPQKLSTIQFLDPDWKETLAFKDFKYRYIYTMALNLTGPLASAPSGFTLLNFDVTKYGYVPATPAFAYIQRGLPYGPGSAPLISDRPLGPIELFLAFRAQTRNLPSELVTGVSMLASDSHDQYQPYLEPSVLAQTVNPLKQIANLNAEGNRNTYWVSTALGTPDTVNSWQLSYNVVQRLSW